MLRRLPVLVLHAHSRCNCRCLMCDIWKNTESRPLRPEVLARLMPDIRALAVENVVFTGGEPLMNPRLFELCGMLREAGVRITVLSTGLLLDRMGADLERWADELIVSLDGPEAVHDEIRRTPGAFRKLHAMPKAIPVRARCTVQKANCRHLVETAEAARGLGMQSISFLAVDVTSDAFNRELTAMPDLDDIAALEKQIDALDFAGGFIAESRAKMGRIVRHFRALHGLCGFEAPRCNAPWVSAVMETDGSLRPCFFHAPIGNAMESGLAAAVNGPAAENFRAGLDVATNEICKRCVCSLWRPGWIQ